MGVVPFSTSQSLEDTLRKFAEGSVAFVEIVVGDDEEITTSACETAVPNFAPNC